MKYKHLFFDLDHTLWDFDTNAKATLIDLFDLFNLSDKINAPFNDFYNKYLFHNAILWEKYHQGLISTEELKWKRMWRTLLDFKIGDENLSKLLSNNFLEILPTKTNVFPYTFEILNYLIDKKYNLHLITNGFEITQISKLNHSGLSKYFTQIITSEGSNSLKPKREIFDFALSKSGALLHQSIMIGDNLDADILGANNVGMDAVFVNHINTKVKYNPTFTVYNLKELELIF